MRADPQTRRGQRWLPVTADMDPHLSNWDGETGMHGVKTSPTGRLHTVQAGLIQLHWQETRGSLCLYTEQISRT